jgi:hypothetical protein
MLNFFIYVSLIVVTLILVILTFPFRFYLKIDGYRLRLYLYKLKILDHNLREDAVKVGTSIRQTLINNTINKELIMKILLEYGSPLKIIFKIKVRYVKILYFGYRGDYFASPLLYATSNAIASTVGNILVYNDIPFYYNFQIKDEVRFKFSSMIYFTLGTLFEELWKIRRKKV